MINSKLYKEKFGNNNSSFFKQIRFAFFIPVFSISSLKIEKNEFWLKSLINPYLNALNVSIPSDILFFLNVY